VTEEHRPAFHRALERLRDAEVLVCE
jgi:hypothetical protein